MYNRMMIPARTFTTMVLGTAILTVAACGGQAPAPAAPDADAPASTAPSGAASDLSALATGDVVLVDRNQMADQPCHGMANTVMGNCATQEEIDAAIASMSIANAVIIDRNTMADEPCHIMAGMVMGNCTVSEAQAKVDEVRASR